MADTNSPETMSGYLRGFLLLELANELTNRHGLDEACRRIGVVDMDELEEWAAAELIES